MQKKSKEWKQASTHISIDLALHSWIIIVINTYITFWSIGHSGTEIAKTFTKLTFLVWSWVWLKKCSKGVAWSLFKKLPDVRRKRGTNETGTERKYWQAQHFLTRPLSSLLSVTFWNFKRSMHRAKQRALVKVFAWRKDCCFRANSCHKYKLF